MRVAETRAVNRALRKAYGIGICSAEEIGSFAERPQFSPQSKKPTQPANGNYGGPKLRDRLCQIIRQHQLDANLVKAYAIDLVCYSWITGISEVAQVVFVRKRLVEIQYLRTSSRKLAGDRIESKT